MHNWLFIKMWLTFHILFNCTKRFIKKQREHEHFPVFCFWNLRLLVVYFPQAIIDQQELRTPCQWKGNNVATDLLKVESVLGQRAPLLVKLILKDTRQLIWR